MVALKDIPDGERERLVNQEVPDFGPTESLGGPPLAERRIAIITTSGLHRRDEAPFPHGVGEYRIIPDDADMDDLVMSHASTNFDRTGFHQDLNVLFPVDRLRELDAAGEIGSIAAYHYSFMGATPPDAFEPLSDDLAALLKADNVDGVLLTGV